MSTIVTREQLENAAQDCSDLSEILSGPESPGIVVTRLGTEIRTILKVISDLDAEINDAGEGWLTLAEAAADAALISENNAQDSEEAAAASAATAQAILDGSLITATGTNYSRAIADRFSDIKNVLDYIPPTERAAIAALTSTYDAAANLQECINDVATLGGGFVFLPEGTLGVKTSILVPEGVYLVGCGSRQSSISWIDSGTTNYTKGVVYSVKGTDMSPTFVFSTGMTALRISGNGVAPVALALRGQQENCIYKDIVLSGFLDAGLDILSFTSITHGVSFEDMHILPQASTTAAIGVRADRIQKCLFRNITTDVSAGTYTDGFLLTRAVNNRFELIHTEDCDYGFNVSTASANNVYINLEAYRGSGTSTTHLKTTETRYSVHGIRTRLGFTNQLDDGTNIIAAATDTDSVVIERGASYFRRVADTETYTATSAQFIRGARQVAAGTAGVGQAIFRTNGTIAISGTKEVVVDIGAINKGFAGKLTLFSTGSQRYCTEVFFEGFVSTAGSVSGGAVSAQAGSTTTRVTIAAPAAVAGGATAQQFGMVVTNASASFTQVLEWKLEITVQDGQASTMSLV